MAQDDQNQDQQSDTNQGGSTQSDQESDRDKILRDPNLESDYKSLFPPKRKPGK
jgi:hypothetical protein